MSAAPPALAPLEARVLGVLVEKQHTVPDAYPLTLNALVAGCNQKSSRDPVMEAADTEVQAALDRLKSLSLVVESSGGRVMRYAHNVGKALGIPPQSVALLAALFLRGPQTAGELRINSERLHRFGDILAVEAFLRELAERSLARELARAAGMRETRWTHLLSGEPAAAAPPGDAPPAGEAAALRSEIDELRRELAELRGIVEALRAQRGEGG
ncbi:MAG TPA: YceH family protein [Usitatibacter sp.]|nr:YceH family protein [Usitatibacter sp.]